MKTFARIKTVEEIKQQCEAQGVTFDDFGHRTQGRDHIAVGAPRDRHEDGTPWVETRDGHGKGWVLYNVYTGAFFGATPKGESFTSSSVEHEKCKWFKALLSFFYVEK